MPSQGNRRRAIVFATALVALAAAYLAPGAAAAPPPNDNFANATVVGPALPVAVPGTNAEATGEPGEPSHTGVPANPPSNSSVWYRWTPAANMTAVVDICDNSSSPPSIFVDVAVYTGTSVATLGAPVAVGGGFSESPGGCAFRFAASAGTTYSIAVDFYKAQGIANFIFRLRQLAPPANDNYAAATVVGPALPVAATATTIDANTEGGEPAELGGSNARSVWFKWTAGITGPVRVDACDWEARSGDSNQEVGVYTDTNDTFPVAATIATSESCQANFNAVSGQQYRIAFSGPVRGEGDFTLRIKSVTPPSNDNFANAIALGPALPIAIQGDNSFATSQASEPIHGGSGGSNARSVWYTWTPTAAEAGLVAFNACRFDGFAAHLGLYTGSNIAALNPVGTAPGGGSPYCYKLYNAAAGTTYRIAVSSSSQTGDEGAFRLEIHKPSPPANDDFADAQAIGPALPIAVAGTTVDATEQDAAGEPSHWGANNPLHSVWYRWTAPASEAVTIEVCDADFPEALSVYTGSALTGLTEVAQAAESDCDLAFAANSGQSYAIAVDSRDPGYWGTFTLRVNGPSGTPAPSTSNPPAGVPFDLNAAIKQCRKKFRGKAKAKQRKRCIRRARSRAAGG